jgi:hypothetical protein
MLIITKKDLDSILKLIDYYEELRTEQTAIINLQQKLIKQQQEIIKENEKNNRKP